LLVNLFSVPNVLWISIINLVIFSALHYFIALSIPMQFFALAIIASLLGPVVLLIEGTIYFYFILLFNLTVLISVLISTKSFFAKSINQKAAVQ